MKEHIKWIDGVKGLACILVFWHHFCLAFLPGIHFGPFAPSHVSGELDIRLAQSPLSFVLNGNFMVAIFCVLSGFVLSMQIFGKSDAYISKIVFKRYFRLMLPIVPIAIVVALLLNNGLFCNLQAAPYTGSGWFTSYYVAPITLDRFIYSVLAGIWFYGDDTLSTAFWMLKTLFYGSFVAVLLSMVAKQMKKGVYLFLILFIAVLILANDMLWAFGFSVLIAYQRQQSKGRTYPAVGVICVILGCVLGGYPSGVAPTNAYRFLNVLPPWYQGFMLWHILGAGLLIWGLFQLQGICRGLSNRFFVFLGKISYAVYLIHIPLLFGLSAWLFLCFSQRGMSYLGSVGLSFVISNLMLVVLATLYHTFVEKNCNRLIDKCSRYFWGE